MPMVKEDLVAFEKEVAHRFESGEIPFPIHLSGGNEDQLIEIFKDIKRTDFVLSTWRSHYHALLHGIPPDELMRQILAGKSMSINSVDPPFYASSIAGGILPVAVGLGMGIKRKSEDRKVWCFVGDMAAMTGGFEEAARYAWNFRLPVMFVVEDNGKSVLTPTKEVWGSWNSEGCGYSGFWGASESFFRNVRYYKYELAWPHSGTGTHVPF